jgi:hypothetical protein
MKLVPYKNKEGEEVPDLYLVVVPTLFGDAVLFGPASLNQCNDFIIEKMKALGNDLKQQIISERKKQELREELEREAEKEKDLKRDRGYPH